MKGIKRNGVIVTVQHMLPLRKKPCLCIQFEDENCVYKVASFNSEDTANWFCEIMDEFFKGMVKE